MNTIAIDIDDTLTTYEVEGKILKREFPDKVLSNYDFIQNQGWHSFSAEQDSLNKLSLNDIIYFWDTFSKEIFINDKKNPLWNKLMPELLINNPKIAIITARPPKYREITENWLNANNIPHDVLVMTNMKSKLDAIESLGINMLVDDKPDIFKELSDNKLTNITKLIIDKPYNRDLSHDNYTLRIEDLTGKILG